jgi:hypothetical protein
MFDFGFYLVMEGDQVLSIVMLHENYQMYDPLDKETM